MTYLNQIENSQKLNKQASDVTTFINIMRNTAYVLQVENDYSRLPEANEYYDVNIEEAIKLQEEGHQIYTIEDMNIICL